jgi:hypothetical protein
VKEMMDSVCECVVLCSVVWLCEFELTPSTLTHSIFALGDYHDCTRSNHL